MDETPEPKSGTADTVGAAFLIIVQLVFDAAAWMIIFVVSIYSANETVSGATWWVSALLYALVFVVPLVLTGRDRDPRHGPAYWPAIGLAASVALTLVLGVVLRAFGTA